MKKVLVAIDFSTGSLQALAQALQIAEKFKARLLLLHVVHDPAEAPGFYAAKKAGKKVLRNMEQTAQQMMDEFVAAHLCKYKSFDTAVVPGLPAEQIVRLGKKEKADLIVMGTHGRSGLKRLILGSVADRVIRTASCPVLTVHETKEERNKKKKQKKEGIEPTDKSGAGDE